MDLLTAQDAEYGAFKTGSEYGAYKTGKDCAPPPPKVLALPEVFKHHKFVPKSWGISSISRRIKLQSSSFEEIRFSKGEGGAYKTDRDCAPPPPKVLNRAGVELRANLESISQK